MSLKLPILLASLTFSAAVALAGTETLATVNGQSITTNDANTFVSKVMPGMNFDKLDPKTKRQIVDQLVNQALIKNQVIKSGIQNTAAFKAQYAALKDDLAVDMWMKQQMKTVTVSDKEAKTFYDANADKMQQNGKKLPFEKVKPDIINFIKLEKFKELMSKKTESLRAASKVEIKL